MNMRNSDIIYANQLELVKEGKLNYTGKVFTYENQGIQWEIKEIEPIHTYAVWKYKGYTVKKGEKAIAKFAIWKYFKNQPEEEDEPEGIHEKGKCYMKTASFFSINQVEKIAE